jgi:hypothetical protein
MQTAFPVAMMWRIQHYKNIRSKAQKMQKLVQAVTKPSTVQSIANFALQKSEVTGLE